MSTSASRQFRSARNALAEALALGTIYPLRDLPVIGEPPVVPFGGTAQISIEDSELDVVYRLQDQAGQPLPGRARAEAVGTGGTLAIATPAISEDATFTVRATRTSGRDALLLESVPIKVGLDATLPVTTVPASVPPLVIDFGATVTIEVGASQEGVTYRLVARPTPAAADDFTAVATDIALSDAQGVDGTGGAINLKSIALVEDTVVHVRAVKVFRGRNPRPPQTTLLGVTVPVFVRADTGLAVSSRPAIIDHGAPASMVVAASHAGVDYVLHARAIADHEFSRLDPADPATIAVPTAGGEVRIVAPAPTMVWESPPGFAPVGAAAAGTGAALEIPLPARTADTMVLVQARKTHAAGAESFQSSERLAQPAAVLVRPDPRPALRLEATVADGKLVRLAALAGQRGVFYVLTAGNALGELYLHQTDEADAALNKGIGALAVAVDMVVAAGKAEASTSVAPPPIPSLDVASLPLPVAVSIVARRAMNGLTAPLGTATIAPLPAATARPAAVAAGGTAKVQIANSLAGERYALRVNGRQLAEPVAGGAAALTLETGALAAGDKVELWVGSSDAGAAILVERVGPLALTVG